MAKKIICILFSLIIVCSVFVPVCAYTPTGFDLDAKAAMLVSLDTDTVLFEKNQNEKVYPASITKIMTVILMLESDRYNPEEKIAMTKDVDPLITGTGSSVSTLKVGEEIKQIDLAYYVLMSSAGDCAYLLALTFGDTVENFVQMMNDKAAELGLTGTHYTNPVGLHDEQNYTTVYDTYVLTKYALANPTFKEICESPRYVVEATNMSKARTLSTTNFLQDSTTNYYYQYAKGVKTGYTDEAGRCLVSTASYNGYNYMCLVFGCNPKAPKRMDFTDSKNLYKWAFNNFAYKTVADTDNPVCEIPVDLSLSTDFVSLYVKESFITVLPKDADDSTISIKPNIKEGTVFDAPIKKNQIMGTADIIYAEQKIGTVQLVSRENIKSNIILVAWRAIKRFFASTYMKIIYILILIVIVAFIIGIIVLNRKRIKKRRIKKFVPLKDDEKEQ